jgi:TPR repeat protein
VTVDRDIAVRWLTASAYGNFVPAILAIADLSDRGAGMPASPEQATEWLRRAAQLGSPRAQYVLGERLLSGRGTPADAIEGWRQIRGAAALGDASAMLRLGSAVANEGHHATREQRIEGMVMLLLALRVGSDDIKRAATPLRTDIQRHMFPDEIAEATTRARAWQPPAGAAEVDGPRMQAEAPRPPGPANGRPGQGRSGSGAQRR